jgi:hypothetical protein
MDYCDTIKKERSRYNETNDCSVVAVSIVLGIGYGDAHKLLENMGRKHMEGAFQDQILAAVRSFGASCERVLNAIEPWSKECKTPISLQRNIPDGDYLVFTRRHVFAVTSKRVRDWTEGRRHRILAIFRVKK